MHKVDEETGESEYVEPGWPSVKCKKKGYYYKYDWTYKKDGLLDKPRCKGCGKTFDIDGDEDHTVIIIG